MIIPYPVIREAEEFHGFRTVHFYELECAKAGQQTRRVPCYAADGTEAIALLTICPTGNPASYDGLDILTDDEAHCLYSGAVRHDGSDLEAVLQRSGYSLTGTTADDSEEGDMVQLSLFG